MCKLATHADGAEKHREVGYFKTGEGVRSSAMQGRGEGEPKGWHVPYEGWCMRCSQLCWPHQLTSRTQPQPRQHTCTQCGAHVQAHATVGGGGRNHCRRPARSKSMVSTGANRGGVGQASAGPSSSRLFRAEKSNLSPKRTETWLPRTSTRGVGSKVRRAARGGGWPGACARTLQQSATPCC